MNDWKPITLIELSEKIEKTEINLKEELLKFWQQIKIKPIKWTEEKHGEDGSGFGVVAVCETKVIWYNDIEEGFNISEYKIYGQIEKYYCDQDDLSWSVAKLFDLNKHKA